MRELYATYDECSWPTYMSSCNLGSTCAQYNEAVSHRSTNPAEKLRILEVDEVRNLSPAQLSNIHVELQTWADLCAVQ